MATQTAWRLRKAEHVAASVDLARERAPTPMRCFGACKTNEDAIAAQTATVQTLQDKFGPATTETIASSADVATELKSGMTSSGNKRNPIPRISRVERHVTTGTD